MAQTYTISAVSQQEPRRYEGQYGVTLYYKVKLKEHGDTPVDIGRKEGNAPREGEEVFGDIERTEYGDKFKAVKKPFGGSSFGGGKSTPRDDDRIVAQWAIGQAKDWVGAYGTKNFNDIEAVARDFYAMVERVKGSQGLKVRGDEVKPSGLEQARNQAAAIKARTSNDEFASLLATGDKVVTDFDPEEPINLDDIPF